MIVTKTVYLIAKPTTDYNFELGEYVDSVEFLPWPYKEYGEYKAISSTEVSFEISELLNPKQLKIEALEREAQKLKADFQARITEIQHQINECLAIEG